MVHAVTSSILFPEEALGPLIALVLIPRVWRLLPPTCIVYFVHCCRMIWQPGIWSSHIVCWQARFLLAKLNPSATHQSDQGLTSEVIFTEDVSLEVGSTSISCVLCQWVSLNMKVCTLFVHLLVGSCLPIAFEQIVCYLWVSFWHGDSICHWSLHETNMKH